MVVKVEHLWKTFQIPHERRTTLFENLAGIMMPRRYETFTVLKDVSFEVDEGEFVGIIGDNGSGKSTLLKIIANILRPTKGTVNVKGKMTPFLELGVGFQPDLTVKENIGVYATVMGLTRREINEKRDEVIEFAGLENFEDTKLKNLSSGMQVRLAFSTAIQTKPDVLLVDEVLAVGDMEFQQKCFDVFDRYRKEGVTILFVSHDLGAVRKFCDKTLLLKNGGVVSYGETNYVIDKYIYKQSEIDAETSATGTNNEERKTRWGDNKIEILGVKFLDKNGMDNSNFISMDTMTVRILYDSHEKVHAPVFGIAFYGQDIYCYGTNTEFGKCDTGMVFGKGHVDFAIERLPMLTGKYEVTVAIVDSIYRTTYDWHDRLYSFEVHNPTRDQGIFCIEGKWNHPGVRTSPCQ